MKQFYLQFIRDPSKGDDVPIHLRYRQLGYSIYRNMLTKVNRADQKKFTQLLASDEDFMSFENFATAICNGDLEIWLADIQAFLLNQAWAESGAYIKQITDEYQLEAEIHNFLRCYPEGVLESELTLELDK